ncbi:hypothetical protein D3C71_1056080 [compost metagenome]
MVQTEALIPRRTFLNTVLQAAGVITQRMQGRQLVIRYGRMLHQSMRLLRHGDNLQTIDSKRQQRPCSPDTDDGHQRPGKRLLPRHTDTAATHAGTVINNSLPGHRQGQRMAL